MNNSISTEKIKLSDYKYRILQIETTAACNMACSFCPYPLKEDKSSILAIEEIKKILDQIDPTDPKFKYVTFSQYNEPLLDKRIFEIIDYAQKCGLKVYMITNGLLLNKEKNVKAIFDLKPDIKISLQVLDKNIHKEARGLNLELDHYVKTIVNFCKRAKNKPININVDIGSNFNDNKFDFYLKKIFGLQTGDPAVPSTVESTIQGFHKYLGYFVEIADEKNKYEILMNKEQIYKNFFSKPSKYESVYNIYDNVKLHIKPFMYGRKIANFKPLDENAFSCYNEILAILADGNIVPCCLAYDDSISLGKSNEISLKNVLDNNEFLKNLRDKNGKKHMTCRKCFGEPTWRGVFIKNLIYKNSFLKKSYKKIEKLSAKIIINH